MKQVILLGRGGQGAVTSSRVLAIAAYADGKFSQAFPNFGVERMGAPVRSYTRIDKKFINLRDQVYEADTVLSVVNAAGVANATEQCIFQMHYAIEEPKAR